MVCKKKKNRQTINGHPTPSNRKVFYNYSRGKPRKNRCGDNVCPQCGRTYVHKYTMQTHIKYECNKEPQFICQFCGKGIYYPSNYKKHLMSKHDYQIDQHNMLAEIEIGSDTSNQIITT
uniref:Longitudinals lacking protein, isoforms A/B/D/L n=1 Tax=Sipha flava TaxID=143950 RepID=A0A2S2QI18_9HEMI